MNCFGYSFVNVLCKLRPSTFVIWMVNFHNTTLYAVLVYDLHILVKIFVFVQETLNIMKYCIFVSCS